MGGNYAARLARQQLDNDGDDAELLNVNDDDVDKDKEEEKEGRLAKLLS